MSQSLLDTSAITLVVCPPTLLPQWEAEIRRFVTPGAVDVLRYEGELEKRLTWWEDVFTLSKAAHKILLALPNVCRHGYYFLNYRCD